MTKSIESYNISYQKAQRQWKLVRDLIEGEHKLKESDISNFQKSLNTSSVLYLPYTSPNRTVENDNRYLTYVQRAALFNATSRTRQGMLGMIFSSPNVNQLPEDLQYLNYNCDGTGVGIEEQAVELISDLLVVGRGGLFVDYPTVETELSLADINELNYTANIIKYNAEDICDWQCEQYGSSMKLTMVKLKEYHCSRDEEDIFTVENEEYWRVLLLNEGVYENRLYTSEDQYTSVIPVDSEGNTFSFIPFYFVGANDNRPDVDTAPLLELAELNIKHYRNSADFEESVFLVGQPVVSLNGLTQTWIDENYPDGIVFGSRMVIMLPENADIKIVQASENTMASKGMQTKEDQMKMLGARLLTNGGAAETAAASRIKHASDGACAKIIVNNATLAYQSAIMAAQLYNGSITDFEFKINTNFFADSMSIDDIMKVVTLWQEGIVDKRLVDEKLKDI